MTSPGNGFFDTSAINSHAPRVRSPVLRSLSCSSSSTPTVSKFDTVNSSGSRSPLRLLIVFVIVDGVVVIFPFHRLAPRRSRAAQASAPAHRPPAGSRHSAAVPRSSGRRPAGTGARRRLGPRTAAAGHRGRDDHAAPQRRREDRGRRDHPRGSRPRDGQVTALPRRCADPQNRNRRLQEPPPAADFRAAPTAPIRLIRTFHRKSLGN